MAQKRRPKGAKGHVQELARLGRNLPEWTDLASALSWVVRLDEHVESAFDDVRLTGRQRTAVAFLLRDALARATGDQLRADHVAIFEDLNSLSRGRAEFVAMVATRMAAEPALERDATVLLGRVAKADSRWGDARSAYRLAWDLDVRRTTELAADLAWAAIKAGDVDGAQVFLESATKMFSGDARLLELLRIASSPSARA